MGKKLLVSDETNNHVSLNLESSLHQSNSAVKSRVYPRMNKIVYLHECEYQLDKQASSACEKLPQKDGQLDLSKED